VQSIIKILIFWFLCSTNKWTKEVILEANPLPRIGFSSMISYKRISTSKLLPSFALTNMVLSLFSIGDPQMPECPTYRLRNVERLWSIDNTWWQHRARHCPARCVFNAVIRLVLLAKYKILKGYDYIKPGHIPNSHPKVFQ